MRGAAEQVSRSCPDVASLHPGYKPGTRSSTMQNKTWINLIAALALILPLLGAAEADERKDLAFEVIDRNAGQMTDISDSIYYFGELGMQEFEGAKLLKDTLEAAGFRVEGGGAGMPANVWAACGSVGARKATGARNGA